MSRLVDQAVAEKEPVVLESACDPESVRLGLIDHLVHTVGKDPFNATNRDWFAALAFLVRDRLAERWMITQRAQSHRDTKRVYYLSLEFLIGRSLIQNLLSLGIYDVCRGVFDEAGLVLEDLAEMEPEAALGNGGLGRLAACFLDSMATLGLPGFGYGLRYEYGMFSQRIENGWQVEGPDKWLQFGNPWEFARPTLLFEIPYGGRLVSYRRADGRMHHEWVDASEIIAMAYDIPVAGYGGDTVNTLRLWAAKSSRDFDLGYFNTGNYIEAVKEKDESENLTRVLYPADTTEMGRELRLKQEYFFVSASLQDIIGRFLETHRDFALLPDKVAIQINDTHPAIAVAELMRLLMDTHGLDWDAAWEITRNTINYTNHTLLPEALETWPVSLFEQLLPRHLQIIYDINSRFLGEIAHAYPGDQGRLRRMSLIDEDGGRRVRMAHLAVVGSHKVNGVAALHTQLLRSRTFPDFDSWFPGRFVNMTNGITPRRWLLQANPRLGDLITSHLGQGWVCDLDLLAELARLADDAGFQEDFRQVKQAARARLAEVARRRLGVILDPASLFDVQVKRIHEYKRQLLNILHVVTRYNRIRHGRAGDVVPRSVIFAGKAAPGYAMAKLIIKLIHDVADIVNNDPATRGLLQVVFLPEYNVSLAERIMPSADLSEQISTAGTEASGTGNMKLALNGALTIGTLDGANIEIQDEVGAENIFIFGLDAAQAAALAGRHDPWRHYREDTELREVLDMIGGGYFSPMNRDLYRPLIDSLLNGGDTYLLTADYRAYVECQDRVDALWRQTANWTAKAILNSARMGKFSADRTITEYAQQVWGLEPRQCQVVMEDLT